MPLLAQRRRFCAPTMLLPPTTLQVLARRERPCCAMIQSELCPSILSRQAPLPRLLVLTPQNNMITTSKNPRSRTTKPFNCARKSATFVFVPIVTHQKRSIKKKPGRCILILRFLILLLLVSNAHVQKNLVVVGSESFQSSYGAGS